MPGGTPFAGGKINTGFFALKTSSTWSFLLLEKEWAHNDLGQGRSDQASINHVISLMSSEEKRRHIKVRARRFKSFRFFFFFPVSFFLCPPSLGAALCVHKATGRSD